MKNLISNLKTLFVVNKVTKKSVYFFDCKPYKPVCDISGGNFCVAFQLINKTVLIVGSYKQRSKLIRKVENASGFHYIFQVSILDKVVIDLDWYSRNSWFSFEYRNWKKSDAFDIEIGKLIFGWQNYDSWYWSQLEIANDW